MNSYNCHIRNRKHQYDAMGNAKLSGSKSIHEPKEREIKEMSDYSEVDALIAGRYHTSPEARFQIMAMRKQLAAQKQRIASLIKTLADAPYPYQLSRLQKQVEELKKQLRAHDDTAKFEIRLLDAQLLDKDNQIKALKEEEKMSNYPNIDALIQGRVSGESFNWPQLRHEVMVMQKQLETLQRELEFEKLVRRCLYNLCNKYIEIKEKQFLKKDEEIKQLKISNIGLQDDKRDLRCANVQLMTDKRQLENEITCLRRQRNCLHKYFGINPYKKLPKELIGVLEEIDGNESS